MAAKNDHTFRLITTAIRPTTDAYREGWERIFGKEEDGEPPKDLTGSARSAKVRGETTETDDTTKRTEQ